MAVVSGIWNGCHFKNLKNKRNERNRKEKVRDKNGNKQKIKWEHKEIEK